MNYFAIYTLTIIVLFYGIFVTYFMRNGKFFHVFIHPYTLICLYFALSYRYRSEFDSIALFADVVIAIAFALFSISYWFGYFVLKTSLIKKFHSFILLHHKNQHGPAKTKNCFWFYFITLCLCLMVHYLCQYISVGSLEDIFFQNYNIHFSRNYVSPPFQFIRGVFNTIFFVSPFFSLWMLFYYSPLKKCTLKIVLAGIFLFISSTGLYLTGFTTYVAVLIVCPLILFYRYWLIKKKLCKVLFIVLISFILYSTLVIPLINLLRTGYDGFASLKHKRNVDVVAYYKNFFNKKILRTLDKSQSDDSAVAFKSSLQIPDSSDTSATQNEIKNNSSDTSAAQNKIKNSSSDTSAAQNKIKNSSSDTSAAQNEIKRRQVELEKKILMDYKGGGHCYSRQIAWQLLVFPKYINFLGIKALLGNYLLLLPKPVLDLFSIEHKMSVGTYVTMLKGWKKGSQPSGPFGEGYVCYGFLGGYIAMICVSFCLGLCGKIAVYGLFIDDRDDEFQVFSLMCLMASPFAITVGIGLFIPIFYGITVILLGRGFGLIFVNKFNLNLS